MQNGSISCIALALSVPGGTREVLAENVLAAWLDLEVASGNDAIASHSEIRKTAKLMGQFLPGTDFVTSGYSSMPRYDNMFGGGNYDSHDYDEWLTIQRDWQVDAGIEPLAEEDAVAVRERAARARAGGVRGARLPAGHRRRGALAATCLDSRDLPDRDRAADVLAGDRVLAEGISGLDVARALDAARLRRRRRRPSSTCSGSASRPTTSRPRRSSTPTARSSRRSTTRTDYSGPGHRLPPRGRALGAAAPAAVRDRRAPARRGGSGASRRRELGPALPRRRGRTRS